MINRILISFRDHKPDFSASSVCKRLIKYLCTLYSKSNTLVSNQSRLPNCHSQSRELLYIDMPYLSSPSVSLCDIIYHLGQSHNFVHRSRHLACPAFAGRTTQIERCECPLLLRIPNSSPLPSPKYRAESGGQRAAHPP